MRPFSLSGYIYRATIAGTARDRPNVTAAVDFRRLVERNLGLEIERSAETGLILAVLCSRGRTNGSTLFCESFIVAINSKSAPRIASLRPHRTSRMKEGFCIISGSMRTDWPRHEVSSIYHQPLLDLLLQAQKIHREFHPCC
jgi:hypothetical protein